MKIVLLLLLFLTVTSGFPGPQVYADHMTPSQRFFIPFQGPERDAFRTFQKRCVASYGDYRRSKVAGHRHGGVDLKGTAGELVYAVGHGRVAYRYWLFPNETVAIMHQLPDGKKIYSIYTHIGDIRVNPGDSVDEQTAIGRLFNSEELRKARFSLPHLHLEIRKNMEDMGRASFTAMSKEELDRYALDPAIFFKSRMK